MTEMVPKLEILPPAQRSLWNELKHLPKGFVLYGGTGLALRLGHRTSVDFDFFSSDHLNRRALERLDWVSGAEVLQDEPDALTVSVDRGNPVKVSFFGPVGFGRVHEPEITGDGVTIASLLDLAATKLKVLLQRVEAKDYLDIAALLRTNLPLGEMLAAARCLFGEAFNPLAAQKTLAWFAGGDLSVLDAATRALLVAAATAEVEIPFLRRQSPRLE